MSLFTARSHVVLQECNPGLPSRVPFPNLAGDPAVDSMSPEEGWRSEGEQRRRGTAARQAGAVCRAGRCAVAPARITGTRDGRGTCHVGEARGTSSVVRARRARRSHGARRSHPAGKAHRGHERGLDRPVVVDPARRARAVRVAHDDDHDHRTAPGRGACGRPRGAHDDDHHHSTAPARLHPCGLGHGTRGDGDGLLVRAPGRLLRESRPSLRDGGHGHGPVVGNLGDLHHRRSGGCQSRTGHRHVRADVLPARRSLGGIDPGQRPLVAGAGGRRRSSP